MDKEAIAIELLYKVGSAGVTPGSVALVLEAFEAISAPAPKARKAVEPVAEPVPAEPVVEAAPAEEVPAS